MNTRLCLVIALAVVLGLSQAAIAECEALVTEQLTNNDTDDTNIKVSGNNAVWVGQDPNADKEIYFFNGNSVTKLTDNETNDIKPQIQGRKIVWQGRDPNGSDWEIFIYNGVCIQQLTDNNNVDDTNPRLSGTRIFWERHDGNDFEIMSAAVPKEVAIKVTPRTLNLKSKGKFINVQVLMNDSVKAADVNIASLILLDKVPPARVVVSAGRNTLMIKFGRAEVSALLAAGNSVEITLTGKLDDGTVFTASDRIRVINPGK